MSSPHAFGPRHIGPDAAEIEQMLAVVGAPTLDALVDEAVPAAIRSPGVLELPPARTEASALEHLRGLAARNEVRRSYLGLGYHGTHTPAVIRRNVLENPGWYTAYTPYQAEISQGRLEALLVFQTVVEELCGLEVANASLLDEATAAAEAMTMLHRMNRKSRSMRFLLGPGLHAHTLDVVRTRAEPLGIELVDGDPERWDYAADPVFGVLLQGPTTEGRVVDVESTCTRAHAGGALVAMATDLLALCLIRSPGEMGVDVAIGNSQRFGVPMGYGGPHAAFMATRAGSQRQLPGRLIGVSRDAHGAPALRMALQTREQHIRRERATSNICTAQVLLAVMAGMYAVWHGPSGLVAIAQDVHRSALALALGLRRSGLDVGEGFFDTLRVEVPDATAVIEAAAARGINLRALDATAVCVALDETVTARDLDDLLAAFGAEGSGEALRAEVDPTEGPLPRRTGPFLQQPVFHTHRSETEMMRYLHRLEARDLTLNTSMIPLGSCTMKLNAAAEMEPVGWPGFSSLHPFAPVEQAAGYAQLFSDLETWLAEITGFDAVSLQPNAGSQGEYAGLLCIRQYHEARGEGATRNICLIPTSAHGTNPASAVLAGLKVVPVKCDDHGNIDIDDLRERAAQHADHLAALMVTYPSTHGVFEEAIGAVCDIVHEHGGQVYLDGANMNAMVGLCRPGRFGGDVCHLNLHKTFAIPHGGGGPGVGPICVRSHLEPYLPGHSVVSNGRGGAPVAAAPWGSASVLPITWAYIAMSGAEGLTHATKVAILAANYVAKRLEGRFDVVYTGRTGRLAHECILDVRPFKAAGVLVDDVAKRLMDYGFHAPTMSFPVAGTLMVEPTESECKAELDRFCDAMLAIREEIRQIEEGEVEVQRSALRHAPHTAASLIATTWERAYPREAGAYPAPWTRAHKYWPVVGRIDNAHGDRNLVCACDAWPDE